MHKGDTPTLKQRRFVTEYLKTGNGTQSALKAYDTEDPNTAHAIASENLRKPTIRTLIEEFADEALTRIKELSKQEKNLNVALGASRDILDRAGFKPPERNYNVNTDYKFGVIVLPALNEDKGTITLPPLNEHQ